jgi:hypothetical protein
MSLVAQLKRSIRANRRAIKRALPFQGFDALARRQSFIADMWSRGLGLYAEEVEHPSPSSVAAHICVPFRLASLAQDPAVSYLPATGAP